MLRLWLFGPLREVLAEEADGGAREDEHERDEVRPLEFLAQHEPREDAKDREGDGFLDDFELRRSERAAVTDVADAVGGDLEDVLGQGDEPGDADGGDEHPAAVLQVVVPREGHEDVGGEEEEHGGEPRRHGRA